MMRHYQFAPVIGLVLLLTGCGGEAKPTERATVIVTATVTAETTRTVTAAPSFSASPSPIASDTATSLDVDPVEKQITISCREEGPDDYGFGEKTSFGSLAEAWAAPPEDRVACSVEEFVPVGIELEAVTYAYGPGKEESAGFMYSICAEPYEDNGYLPLNEDQRRETEGALILCPTHPDRQKIEAEVAEGARGEEALAEGRWINPGLYRVNSEVQPGQYYAEDEDGFSNCYWERLDAAGEIIDNGLVSDGFRVEAYIDTSDYSFSQSGCGTLKPL